jgi:hypothetical protein
MSAASPHRHLGRILAAIAAFSLIWLIIHVLIWP